jgi:hypothetical protein
MITGISDALIALVAIAAPVGVHRVTLSVIMILGYRHARDKAG